MGKLHPKKKTLYVPFIALMAVHIDMAAKPPIHYTTFLFHLHVLSFPFACAPE